MTDSRTTAAEEAQREIDAEQAEQRREDEAAEARSKRINEEAVAHPAGK